MLYSTGVTIVSDPCTSPGDRTHKAVYGSQFLINEIFPNETAYIAFGLARTGKRKIAEVASSFPHER